MFIAYALQTEPDYRFVRVSFCATENERDAEVENLSVEFADDRPVEIDSVSLPDEPIPTPTQAIDPSYLHSMYARIVEANGGEVEWLDTIADTD